MRSGGTALIAGALFGLGLGVSQMINPAKVIGFLDVFGAWDPTLMFVLGGAVGVTALGFRPVLKRSRPVCDGTFLVPKRTKVDVRLVAGAAIFGIGWGMTGYCPGPGLASLVLGSANTVWFAAAFVTGLLLTDRLARESKDDKKSEDG